MVRRLSLLFISAFAATAPCAAPQAPLTLGETPAPRPANIFESPAPASLSIREQLLAWLDAGDSEVEVTTLNGKTRRGKVQGVTLGWFELVDGPQPTTTRMYFDDVRSVRAIRQTSPTAVPFHKPLPLQMVEEILTLPLRFLRCQLEECC
jgi:hypothetical protein